MKIKCKVYFILLPPVPQATLGVIHSQPLWGRILIQL